MWCDSRKTRTRKYPQLAYSTPPEEEAVQPGCVRYTVHLKRPLGCELEQDKATGKITVAAIKPHGTVAHSGKIEVGDELVAVSGVVYPIAPPGMDDETEGREDVVGRDPDLGHVHRD
eukprot:gene27267-2521_t